MIPKQLRLLFYFLCWLMPGHQALAQELIRVALPAQINSPFIELRPYVTADGRTLYFGRREHPDNVKGTTDIQDIYVVTRDGNGWSTPQNMGEAVNNRFANSLGSISPEGNELLLLNTYKNLEGPLARMHKNGDAWGAPESVYIDNFHNYSEYFDFYQSYADNVLFLAAEREDSRGDQDIYVCLPKGDGNWGKPINLGPVINTKKSDFAPFMAADGKTLFFASYGHKGKGGADLFFSERLDQSWTKWSKPVNLGPQINSSGEETYCSVTADLRHLYYVSYRMGSDKRDIFYTLLPPDLEMLKPSDTSLVVMVNKNFKGVSKTDGVEMAASDTSAPEASNESETVNLKPAVAKEKGETFIRMSGQAAEQEKNKAKTGASTRSAPSQQAAQAAMQGLGFNYREISSSLPQLREYQVLRNVYFDFNQTGIKKNTYEGILQKVLLFMQANPAAQLKLIGHADELGTKSGNQKISQLRAQSVKKYLVQQGIAAERILVHFRGEEEPLATNDDDREGRELNRRVEFNLLLPDIKH